MLEDLRSMRARDAPQNSRRRLAPSKTALGVDLRDREAVRCGIFLEQLQLRRAARSVRIKPGTHLRTHAR